MMRRFITRWASLARRLTVAGLVVVAGATQAASGYVIDRGDEQLISPGMTAQHVREVLGPPSKEIQVRNAAGPTFVYTVAGRGDFVFDVDFGPTGLVASAGERMVPLGGGSGRRR
jgi:hypothetical protein